MAKQKTKNENKISIEEIGKSLKGAIGLPKGIDNKDVEKAIKILETVEIACLNKKGSAEAEISKFKDDSGSVTQEQIEYITQKYDSVIPIKDEHSSAYNLTSYGARNQINLLEKIFL